MCVRAAWCACALNFWSPASRECGWKTWTDRALLAASTGQGEGVVAGPAWDPGVRGCVRGREGGFANLGPGLELDTECNICKGLTDHIIHVKLQQQKES